MAQPRTLRTRAIVIDHRTRLSEKDEILTLLLADGQQVGAVAKGALKPGGRLAARVELFCETDFLLAHGRNLDIVSEAALINAHPHIRGDLARMCAASVICEVARLTSYQGYKDEFLYPICSRALTACEQCSDQTSLDVVVSAYAFKVLAHQGWRPELDACVLCGDPKVSYFSAQAGGTLCSSCATGIAGAEPITTTQRDWIRSLIMTRFDDLVNVNIDLETSSWLLATAHIWCATHLDARLRSFEFMVGL